MANEFTTLESKRDAMRAGITKLLASLSLTRNDFAGMGDADTLFALSTTFQKQGCINASLTTLKLANTARELETVTPESLGGFFAAHNARIEAERQVSPAAQELAASWQPQPTLTGDLAEMMAGWNTIEAAAKEQFPGASPEEIYQTTASAMNRALGLPDKRASYEARHAAFGLGVASDIRATGLRMTNPSDRLERFDTAARIVDEVRG